VLAAIKTGAEAGNAEHQAEYGLRLMRGDGFEEDLPRSIHWLRKGAEQGEARAQCQLGFLCLDGKGLPQDHQQSLDWFRKAAVQGHTEAQFALACLFEKGIDVNADATEAAMWYQRAAAKDHVRAQLNLGMLLCVARQEYADGIAWLREAAEQGNADAALVLGKSVRLGQGTKRDDIEAYKWFRLAVIHGARDAETELRACAAGMTPRQIATAEQRVMQFKGKHR
jgi:TPR repeat protein